MKSTRALAATWPVLWVVTVLLQWPSWAGAVTGETATVTYVADGDTVYVRGSGQELQQAIRLLGIDAPEICQEGGAASRQALQTLLLGQSVTLVRRGPDSFGRDLALVYWQGQDVGRWMVQQGWAWSYRFGRDAGPYLYEQDLARSARKGLFAQAQPEPPYLFRRRHGSCKTGP